jgi:AraC-like DNA-binding protein
MTEDLTAYVVRPTIPARYLADVLARARLGERREAQLLRESGLPPRAHALPRFRISVEQFERVYRVVRKACDDEMFGFFERPVPPGAYAVLLRSAIRCGTVAEVLDAAGRFYALFDRHRYWTLSRAGREARLEVRCKDAAQASSIFFVHSMLLTPWRTAAWLSGAALPLTRVCLEPRFGRYASETAFLFGCEPRLERGRNELRFDARWLDAPVVRTPADADVFVRGSLRVLLSAPAGDTLEMQVRGILASDRPFASADLSSVARRLHLSRASLTRRLQQRGRSFQQIKDDLRRDHAIALLSGAGLPVSVVSERLGFSQASAFQRAFKAWTGAPPGRYRASAEE